MSEYVMSKRGKEHITNDGYIYRCRYIKNKVEYFTCVVQNCKGKFRQNENGKRCLMDNGKRCLIFASNKSLVALCSSKTLFMDGTFKASCKQFQQLYIIHGEISVYSEYVRLPLVFILCLIREKKHIYKYSLVFLKIASLMAMF